MVSPLRRFAAALCVPLALALTGCGMDVQTLQPYTPAEGVNTNAGQALVRNLVVIADGSGRGVVSASVLSPVDDSLTAVSGVPQKFDGQPGSALTVTAQGLPLQMTGNSLYQLTAAPVRVAVTSPDLKPGQLAQVTISFAKSGQVTIMAPVVSSAEPQYADIKVGA